MFLAFVLFIIHYNFTTDTFSKNIQNKSPVKVSTTKLNQNNLATNDLIKQEQREQTLPNKNIDPKKPMIALTFDDGPNYKTTNKILDILKNNNSNATFFVTGRRSDKDYQILPKMLELGNQIGNHTYNHTNLTKLSQKDVEKEIETVNDKLVKFVGSPASLVRVPYGAINSNILNNFDYPFIMWNVDTQDWKSRNSKKIINETLKNLSDGNIILMHDIYETTAKACEFIIPEIIKKGFQLVTIQDMMEYKNIELKPNKKYFSAIS